MKYTKEFKLECIKKFKNGEYIEDPPGVKHSSFRHQIVIWSRIYDSIGEVGLEHKKTSLSISQKLELFKRIEDGESFRSVSCSIGISHVVLIKWYNIYRQKGIDGLKSLKRGRKAMTNKKPKKDKTKSELEQLREEVEYLRAENEYLKKLDALVQKRKDQPQKKK